MSSPVAPWLSWCVMPVVLFPKTVSTEFAQTRKHSGRKMGTSEALGLSREQPALLLEEAGTALPLTVSSY